MGGVEGCCVDFVWGVYFVGGSVGCFEVVWDYFCGCVGVGCVVG